MLNQETKRKIDSARDILVGKIPDPKTQIDQITIALIYKFMDDMDKQSEELGGVKKFFTKEYEKYAWSNLMDKRLSAEDRLSLYIEAINNIPKNPNIPELFRNIIKGAFLPYNDARILNLFLKQINEFSYDHSEDLGDAFEYLLSVLGSQGEAGQFRTPRHIIDFIVEVVDPQKNESILDPACGTAGFLISSYKHILKANENKPLTPDEQKKLSTNLVGYDIDPGMIKLALVNMYLHKFKTPKIHEYDTLTNDSRWGEIFDVILANPPFMSPKGGINPHKMFSIQANRAEVLFVDYIAEHLTFRGRAGIIVPEGIIFQSANAYKALRKNLIENWGLYAVVSLPSGVFQPYSGVKTSILLLDKELAKKVNEILFIKVQNDGYDLGAQRRPIDKNDLPLAQEILRAYKQAIEEGKSFTLTEEQKPIAHLVPKSKIAETGDYNLTGDRYKEVEHFTHQKWPMVELGEVCEIYQPKTITSKEIKGTGKYKVFGANGAIGYFDKYNHEDSEIAITCRGATCGTVNFTEPKSWITGNAMVVKPRTKNLDKKYLYYFLKISNLNSVISGAAQPQITRSGISPFRIPLPPLEVQQKIVDTIETKQRAIDAAKAVISALNQDRKTFGEKVAKIEGVEWVELGDDKIFEIESGGTPDTKKQEYWNGDINWVTLIDLPNDNYITEIEETKRKITKLGLLKSSAKLLPEGSILISSRATIGRIAIAKKPTTTNQGFKNVIIKDKTKALSYFVAMCIASRVDEIKLLATGGTFGEVSKSKLRTIKLPLPPLEVQQKLVAEMEEKERIAEANKKLIAIMEREIQEVIESI